MLAALRQARTDSAISNWCERKVAFAMANTRGGPGYAKLKSEYLRANLPDPQNVKNANTLSGALTMRWAHGHSVPVEYLATRALKIACRP